MEGQCQCGQIKFKTPTSKPLAIYVCHCWNCRHQSSSLFGVTARFNYFKIEAPFPGAISIYSRPNPNGQTKGYFCTKCGSRLLHENIGLNGDMASTVSVKAGCLDGLSQDDYKQAIHIWTSRAVSEIPSGVKQYPEEPPEDYL